jgi:two-component system, LytTR family, sensor kinase
MKNPFLNRTFSIIYAIVWLVIISSQIAILSLIADSDILSAIIQSFVANVSFAVLGLGIWFVVKYNLGHKGILQTIVVFLIAGMFVVGIWMGFNFVIQNLLFTLSEGRLIFMNHPLYQFTTGVFLYTIFVLVYRMMILFYKYGEKARSEEKLQKLVTETRLQALKAYINPHFLFNSLNSVNALITINPEKAREMLINLSEYFRYSLKQKDNSFISLEEEMHYTLTYFEIERLRFGDKLELNCNICPLCKEVKVPVMILQPLFENIIKHAVSESLSVVVADFKAEISGDFLVVSLSNNYDIDGISKKGTGIGLQTTYDRISLIYHKNDLMYYSRENGNFVVELKIPLNFKE